MQTCPLRGDALLLYFMLVGCCDGPDDLLHRFSRDCRGLPGRFLGWEEDRYGAAWGELEKEGLLRQSFAEGGFCNGYDLPESGIFWNIIREVGHRLYQREYQRKRREDRKEVGA